MFDDPALLERMLAQSTETYQRWGTALAERALAGAAREYLRLLDVGDLGGAATAIARMRQLASEIERHETGASTADIRAAMLEGMLRAEQEKAG